MSDEDVNAEGQEPGPVVPETLVGEEELVDSEGQPVGLTETRDGEFRRIYPSAEAVVVNCNWDPHRDMTYTVAYGGDVHTFPPLEPTRIPANMLQWMLDKAASALDNSRQDTNDTEREYLKLLSSKNHVDRMRAERLVDANGKLRTFAWKYPPLLNYVSKNGRAAFEQALKDREKIARDIKRGKIKPEVVDLEEMRKTALFHEMEKPHIHWSKDQLRDYLTGSGEDWHPAEKEQKLVAKALRIHELKVKTLRDAGMTVREV